MSASAESPTAPSGSPDVIEPTGAEQAERTGPTAVVLTAALLIVAGLVLLLVAVLHTNHDVVPLPWSQSRVRLWCLAVGVLSLLVPVARRFATGRPADSEQRMAAGIIALVAAGCSIVVAWVGLVGLSRGISRSFAGSTPLLFLGGGVSVGVGMATLAFTRSRRLRRPTTRALALCWLPAAVAVVLTLVASTTAPGWFVSRTTAAPVAAAPVPTSIAHESWSTPVTGRIRELIAAGAGAVLSNNREIEALDGTTGRVRWTYARHGTVPFDLIASPDGRTVAFALDRGEGKSDLATQTVVLDAFTGRTRITYAEPKDPHGLPSPYLTDDSLIVGTGLGFDQPTHVFRAISLTSGRTAWTYTDPTNCPGSNNPAYAAVPGGLLIAHACDGGPAITLFDGASGAKKWTVPWPNTVMLSLTPDGRYLAGETKPGTASREHPNGSPDEHSLIDTRTGRAVLHGTNIEITPGGPIEQSVGDTTILRDPHTLKPLTVSPTARRGLEDRGSQSDARPIGGNWYVRLDDSPDAVNSPTALTVQAGAYSGPMHRITVDVGGPYRTELGALSGITPAPGAVVVWIGDPVVAGHQARVVGLTQAAPAT
jgi:hypothetical protein